jgi:hypothetical protein
MGVRSGGELFFDYLKHFGEPVFNNDYFFYPIIILERVGMA